MKPEDRVRVQHMLDAAQEACEFMGGVSFEGLKRSRLLTNAVVRSLEVLGEAAAQMTPEFRESNGGFHGGTLLQCATGLFMLILISITQWCGERSKRIYRSLLNY